MTAKNKPIVGILINPEVASFGSNGLHQNTFLLYRLLQKIENLTPLLIYDAHFLPKGVEAEDQIDLFGEPVYRLDLFYETYHLSALIEVSVAVSSSIAKRLRAAGTKIALCAYGNRYVLDQEAVCFGNLPGDGVNRNFANRNILRETVRRDAVWMSPHFAWQKDYYKHRFNAVRSYVCPYIWDHEILDRRYEDSGIYKEKNYLFHKGNPANKNIFSTEPNLNVLKTSLFPFQAYSIAYGKVKEEIGDLYLYNSRHLISHNREATSYFCHFDCTADKKVKFLGRELFPKITDSAQIMFHHHFQNGLNYTLLEAARLGLPVVHNSEFMPELGYYYKGANLTDAAKQIENALRHEERDDLEEYNHQCKKVIEKFWIYNKENLIGYKTLIANLLDPSIEPELPQYIINLEHKLEHGDGYISPLG